MGNCFARKTVTKRPVTKRLQNQQKGPNSSNRWARVRSSRKDKPDDSLLQEQALAAAILFRQHQQQNGGASLPFDRSASLRYPNSSSGSKKAGQLPRSSSSRARSLTDPLLQPHQLVNQDIKLDNLETNHFVLVHGGGFGAWCWYKTIALLEEGGFKATAVDLTGSGIHSFDTNGITTIIEKAAYLQGIKLDNLETNHFVLVHGGGFGAWCWYKTIALLEEGGFKATAVDLTGSGIHSFDTNGITSLPQYVKPLTDFLEKLPEGEKVILVGHDFGGACVSYAMELFPFKIAKAVFVAAAMLTNGQSTLDMFTQQAGSNDLMRQAQIFLYANGNDHPPTAIDLDKSLLRDLLFNQSPSKDVALASVSMRPIPFAPVLEKLSLSDMKYGSLRRFYVGTPEDNAIPVVLQESMINSSPPEKVFRLKGADHSPFFSKPQALHKLFVEISKLPSP
ncbi:hypothetical protein GOBAR_AA06907 [Gossypium barbadense]|uniref:AB hydrolase-1 domain-containing protein n=1 Tax=Gossypium barbadense TaxID=3634 RepID=A0A2P5YDT9_GOSBA|nr:hypothetical protein GOBAR_AA06907 [Gossypium barbadense]